MRHTSRKATNIDTRIGKRIRSERIKRGMTLKNVGDVIGVTFQQVRKYELGDNRITVCRLYALAESWGMDIGDFLK